MEETINDRIEQLVKERFGGNKAAFAKAIGSSGAAMSSYLGNQRRSKPSIEMATNIINVLKVDPMWLLTGNKATKNETRTQGENYQVEVQEAVLKERISMLGKIIEEKDKLIEEKERMIQLLMKKCAE